MSETEPPRPPPDLIPNQKVAPPGAASDKSQSFEIPAASQERAPPMLDVHPIHAPVHGWRDFLIHIATIVVGLCIAVGIQQTVESVHHHYQLTEIRQALRLERQENYKVLSRQTIAWRWGAAELQNNLLVFQYLQQHPGTPQEKLPGVLLWSVSALEFNLAVWDAAHQSGVIALMPREEIEANAELYVSLRGEFDAATEAARAIIETERYNLSDSDPSHLSPSQIATEIELTQTAMSRHFLYGTVTKDELDRYRHPPDQQTTELLAPARALTMERLKAAGYIDPNSPPAQK